MQRGKHWRPDQELCLGRAQGSKSERAQDRWRDAGGAWAELSSGNPHFLHLAQLCRAAGVIHCLPKSIHKQVHEERKVTPSLCASSLLLLGWNSLSTPGGDSSLLMGWRPLLLFAPGDKSKSLHATYLIDNIKPGEVAGGGKCFQLRSWTENSCGTECACWLQQLFS